MRNFGPARRHVAAIWVAIALAVVTGVATSHAEGGYPDFYGTVLAVDRQAGTVTLRTDSDEKITVDVRDLGTRPYDEGAFVVDNVIVLRTRAVGGAFVAIGWEQARNGGEEFGG